MVFWFRSGQLWTIVGSICYASGHFAIYLPQFLYDMAVFIFFPLNYLITCIATYIIGSADYTLNPHVGVGSHVLGKPNSEELAALKQHIMEKNTKPLTNHQLMSLFDTLPIASTMEMFGYWNGTIVRSHSLLDLADMTLCQLKYLGFAWGKRYRSPYIGDPLMVSWMNMFHIPIIIWGNVQLNDIEYRGKVNATMVYDHQPWQDYFRILDDGSVSGKVTILGIWASRQKIGGWFTLTSDVETTEAMSPYHRLHTVAQYMNGHVHGNKITSIQQQLATAATRHPINTTKTA